MRGMETLGAQLSKALRIRSNSLMDVTRFLPSFSVNPRTTSFCFHFFLLLQLSFCSSDDVFSFVLFLEHFVYLLRQGLAA
jgi:hypothetical protein